jgi:hypothetical protein
MYDHAVQQISYPVLESSNKISSKSGGFF